MTQIIISALAVIGLFVFLWARSVCHLHLANEDNSMLRNRIGAHEQTEGYIPKGRKLNKTKRGGGMKGAFRGAVNQDSMVNQEKYFVGV